MQLAETQSEHLDVVRGVRFQHRQFVGGLVAVRVHRGPLLAADEPENTKTPHQRTLKSCRKTVGWCQFFSPVVDEEGTGVQRKAFGTRPGQSDGTKKVWRPLEVLHFIGQGVLWEKDGEILYGSYRFVWPNLK